MTDQSPQVVRSYLAQLDVALVGLPADLASDVRSGIKEELSGLDAATASARIEELGDPVFIAAEMRDAVGSVARVTSVAPRPTLAGSRGFTITAALLVAIGGIVVPFLGWVVGIVMVWMSSTWRIWEKWVATLVGPAAIALAILGGLVGTAFEGGGGLGGWHASVVFVGPASAVTVGIWLLWRVKGRVLA